MHTHADTHYSYWSPETHQEDRKCETCAEMAHILQTTWEITKCQINLMRPARGSVMTVTVHQFTTRSHKKTKKTTFGR